MNADTEKLAVEILALPASMRAFLVHKLISSLEEDADDDVEAQWMAVVDRRSQEIEQGQMHLRQTTDVVREIRAKLNVQRRQSPGS